MGRVDILIGEDWGNRAAATTNPERRLFDLPIDVLQQVFNLNSMGTIIPSLVFSRYMAAAGEGVILNISSMNAMRPSRIQQPIRPARQPSPTSPSGLPSTCAGIPPRLRVQRIAPGFFVTEQARYLHVDEHWRLHLRSPCDRDPHRCNGSEPPTISSAPCSSWFRLPLLLSPASCCRSTVASPPSVGFSVHRPVLVKHTGVVQPVVQRTVGRRQHQPHPLVAPPRATCRPCPGMPAHLDLLQNGDAVGVNSSGAPPSTITGDEVRQ